MTKIVLRRIYEDKKTEAGYRALVDRVWPRGITKVKAALDEWNKELTPSPALRKWFSHEPEKWDVFRKKYLKELGASRPAARAFLDRAGKKVVLLYGAKDKEHTHALILKEYLEKLK